MFGEFSTLLLAGRLAMKIIFSTFILRLSSPLWWLSSFFFSIQLMLSALRYSCCIRWLRWNRESSFTSKKKNPPKRRNSHILQWITTWRIFWATTGSSSMSRIGFDLVVKEVYVVAREVFCLFTFLCLTHSLVGIKFRFIITLNILISKTKRTLLVLGVGTLENC